MARKIWFDWASLDRKYLIGLFNPIRKQIVGQKLTPTQIQKILSKHIKQHIPIKVSKSIHNKNKIDNINVGGFYYSWLDKKRYKAIEIRFGFNPTNKFINYSNYKFNKLAINFSDIVLHEIIHTRQFRSRNFKYLPEYPSTAESYTQRQKQIYLGDRDEIDAYAFNVACELIDRFGNNQKNIVNYMNKDLQDTRYSKDCWKMYLDTFDHDHQHPVIKRLKSKTIRYLSNAQIGKPFKTSDWLK